MKRILIVVLFLTSFAALGTAHATDCSPQNTFNTPLPEYSTGTYGPQALGYTAGTGLPAKAWIGAYYQDGYWYVDVQNPSAPTFKMFMNYEQKSEHRLTEAKVVGGASPFVCIHGRTFGQWPFQESGDGCILVSSGPGVDECTFVGGTRSGTQDVAVPGPPPVGDPNTKVDTPVDVPGAYFVASQQWAIYKQSPTGATSIVLSGTAPSAGVYTFTPGVRYWACLGSVNTAAAPANACTGTVAGRGVLVAAHI